jgi:pimeloyl-ACP methyl ester carboxylesterase
MPFLSYGAHTIRYESSGPQSGPAYVLVNGLTQYAELWDAYRDALVAKNFRVVTFDLLGQGESDKPSLFISQDDHVAVLRLLIEQLGDGPVFLAGISFGGLIALRYAIEHGDTLAGLVPMSTFAELSPQLLLLGNVMRTGLILGGTSYLQDMLLPMNLSDAWLEPLLKKLDTVKRQGWLVNDVYALQNLMESFLDFEPLTPKLGAIKIPAMILNGEFDFLTPRPLHDSLRTHIEDSALVIIPAPITPHKKLPDRRRWAVCGRCDEAMEGRRLGLIAPRRDRTFPQAMITCALPIRLNCHEPFS